MLLPKRAMTYSPSFTLLWSGDLSMKANNDLSRNDIKRASYSIC
jgi:hypothetical protein